MRVMAAFFCGLVFGCGLLISEMTEPPRVLGFLDVLGPWDPTLGFVMAGALAVTSAGYAFVRRQPMPVFAERFDWPTRAGIDAPLVVGSILFGIGWGLIGLCPGPAIANLATPSLELVLFVVAMAAGMGLYALWRGRGRSAANKVEGAPAAVTDG